MSKRPCVVTQRSHVEKLKKGSLVTTYKITLHGPDNDKHELVGNNRKLWDDYPVGEERNIDIQKTEQTKLAVEKVREQEEH